MRGWGLIILLYVSFVLFSGCDNLPLTKKPQKTETARQDVKPAVEGPIVALVNDYPITLEYLNGEIDIYNSRVPEDRQEFKIDTREKRIDHLKNDTVRKILLYQEAVDRGVLRNPDVQRALEKTKIDLLVFQILKDEFDKINVTSADIEDYYNRLREEFKREPEKRKIREISVVSQAQARDLLIKILQGEDFAILARQYSRASSAEKGGDLGYIEPGTREGFAEFDEVAFSDALEVGQPSSVFKGPDGYYILKLEDKKGGEQKNISDMWEEIKTLLTLSRQQQRIDDMVGDLSRNAKIEIKEDKVE